MRTQTSVARFGFRLIGRLSVLCVIPPRDIPEQALVETVRCLFLSWGFKKILPSLVGCCLSLAMAFVLFVRRGAFKRTSATH